LADFAAGPALYKNAGDKIGSVQAVRRLKPDVIFSEAAFQPAAGLQPGGQVRAMWLFSDASRSAERLRRETPRHLSKTGKPGGIGSNAWGVD
jgi:hypothetical protein